jgi:DNA-binding transcriptional LysR family regulator
MKSIIDMPQTDLHRIDLNLLKLLDLLIEERGVTRAGARLGLSQPASSRALGRLRLMLGDRLLVKAPGGLVLTPRALALAQPVRRLLEDARQIVAPPIFDPASATGSFTIAAIDRLTALIAPGLVARLADAAPLLDLTFPQPVGDNIDLIVHGAADLAIGVFAALPTGLFQRVISEERYVVLLRKGHPALGTPMTARRFADLSHASVLISGHGPTPVDEALARLGLKRRIAARVPHFFAAAAIVAQTDLLFSMPSGLAGQIAQAFGLEAIDMPLPMPAIATSMIWHERRQQDPAHRWIRDQIADVLTTALRP